MTQGQRIRFVREFRHMTQKELGLACGFPKASADVRIRQYESDQKSPKKDALELIAAALKVNIYSLNNYTTANATDILENLFWMETFGLLELFKLEQVREPDEDWVIRGSYNEPNYFQYHAPIGITVKYNLVNEFMQEWYTRYVEYHQNIISKVFFFFLFLVVSLCEREIKEEEVLSAASIREADSASASSRKAGAKVRTFKHIFQMFPEVFFLFSFRTLYS